LGIIELNINNLIQGTDSLKLNLCNTQLEIAKVINKLHFEINNIKHSLKNFTESDIKSSEMLVKLAVSINNVNLIKANLMKINSILEILKKANCVNFEETSKKYDGIIALVTKLSTNIQNFLRTKNLNINLVVLT